MTEEYDDLDLSDDDQEEAHILANSMIELLVRRNAKIDVAFEAIDILYDTMTDCEMARFEEETQGLNGVDYGQKNAKGD